MDFVPILRRELIVSARRGTIGLRAGIAGLMPLVMTAVFVSVVTSRGGIGPPWPASRRSRQAVIRRGGGGAGR